MPVVARAYLDQLQRASALPEPVAGELDPILRRADMLLQAGSDDPQLADRLDVLASTVSADEDDALSGERRAALGETLHGIAARLR